MKNYNRKQKSPFEWELIDWAPLYGAYTYRKRTKDFRTATEEDVSAQRDSRIYQGAMAALALTGLLKLIL